MTSLRGLTGLAVVVCFVVLQLACKKEGLEGVGAKGYDVGPIKLSTFGGFCKALPGAFNLDPMNNTIAWTALDNPYRVYFQPGEDPSQPGSKMPTFYDVPAGQNKSINVDASINQACSNYGQCVYDYTVVKPDATSCMAGIGSFGIIIKNP